MSFLTYIFVAAELFLAARHVHGAARTLRRSCLPELRPVRRRLWVEAVGHLGGTALWLWAAEAALQYAPR